MRGRTPDFTDLDAFLLARARPVAPEGLSERIIAAAARAEAARPAVRGGGLSAILRRRAAALAGALEEWLYIPRPAYALAAMLVIGLAMGVYSDYLDDALLPGVTTNEISTFLSIDDRFVASEFLEGVTL